MKTKRRLALYRMADGNWILELYKGKELTAFELSRADAVTWKLEKFGTDYCLYTIVIVTDGTRECGYTCNCAAGERGQPCRHGDAIRTLLEIGKL